MNEVYIKATDLNKWVAQNFPNKDLISIDELIGCIEELTCDVEHLTEELEDLKQNIEDNYRPIPDSEKYGISDSDFM